METARRLFGRGDIKRLLAILLYNIFSILIISVVVDSVVDAPVSIYLIVFISAALLLNVFITFIMIDVLFFSKVQRMRESIEKISQGDLGSYIHGDIMSEEGVLGDLARSFSRMLASLKMAVKLTSPELQKELKDVMEKASVEKKEVLRRLESINRTLDKSSIVSMTDVAGDIIYANEKFVEISKYPKEELMGKNHRIIKSGFHSDEFYRKLWTTILDGNVWQGNLRNRAKDGSIYWVRSVIMPNFNRDGSLDGFTAVRTPITDTMSGVEEAISRIERGEDVGQKMKGLVESLRDGTYVQNPWSGI